MSQPIDETGYAIDSALAAHKHLRRLGPIHAKTTAAVSNLLTCLLSQNVTPAQACAAKTAALGKP